MPALRQRLTFVAPVQDEDVLQRARAFLACADAPPHPRQNMKDTIDCRRASRLLSDLQEDALPATRADRLRCHLLNCSACRNAGEQFVFLRSAVVTMKALSVVGPDACKRHN